MPGHRRLKAAPRAGERAAPLVPGPRRQRIPAACLVGLCSFVVYLTSLRAPTSWDTIPARLLPFSILREHNLDLDEFAWLRSLDPPPYFLRQTAQGEGLLFRAQ